MKLTDITDALFGPPTCPICNKNPCFEDKINGGYHETCSKTCAASLKKNNSSSSTAPLCPICNQNFCFSDGKGGYHETCSKYCASKIKKNNSSSSTAPLCPVCNLKPCFSDGNGGFFETCGKTCAGNYKKTNTQNQSNVYPTTQTQMNQGPPKFISSPTSSTVDKFLTSGLTMNSLNKSRDQCLFPCDTICCVNFTFSNKEQDELTSKGFKLNQINSSKDIKNEHRVILIISEKKNEYIVKSKTGKIIQVQDVSQIMQLINECFNSMVKEIHFYEKKSPYYEFTNFYESILIHEGKEWKTSEHLFQGLKFQNSNLFEEVRLLKNPRDAFNFSRTNASSVRSDWHIAKNSSSLPTKEEAMKHALTLKFNQNVELSKLLLSTTGKLLVEHTENDDYWGDGFGVGMNRLGFLLMQVRDNIQNKL
jgi:N-glycosidase YbiA